MKPKELIKKWVELFNNKDLDGISKLYSKDCTNHQTPIGIVKGKENIKNMFKNEFNNYDMVCIVENIFEDDNVGILEWKDPKGLRGCGFFWFENNEIIYQRGYWDKLSFLQQQNTETK